MYLFIDGASMVSSHKLKAQGFKARAMAYLKPDAPFQSSTRQRLSPSLLFRIDKLKLTIALL